MRALRWFRDEAPLTIVLAIALCGVIALTVWPDHWRRDAGLIAVAMFVGGALRLVLPVPRIGALAVRTRWFDVASYLSMGVVILGVAIRLH